MANKKIGIVMGSNSDLETMKEAINILKEFGDFGCEYHICPPLAGTGTFVCNRGGKEVRSDYCCRRRTAHLAGVIASLTPIPVIGVPMLTSGLGGLDSLLSMVQMPSGIPVPTMGIGKSGSYQCCDISGSDSKCIRPKIKTETCFV